MTVLVLLAFPGNLSRHWIPIVPILIAYVLVAARALGRRRSVRIGLSIYFVAIAAVGVANLADSVRLSLSGPQFPDRWTSVPSLRAAYKVAFGQVTPASVGTIDHDALRVLRNYEPRVSWIHSSAAMKRRQIKTAVKMIISTAIGEPCSWRFSAHLLLMRRLPEGFLTERFFQFIAYASRGLPERRTTPWFVQYSLALRDRRFSFKFRSRQVDLFWTATAFPDLLTRHMLFEGLFQEDVLLALGSHIDRGDVVIDVGGHHGLMAIVSARATGDNGRVITFEPNPDAREHLENLHLTHQQRHERSRRSARSE